MCPIYFHVLTAVAFNQIMKNKIWKGPPKITDQLEKLGLRYKNLKVKK